MGTNEKLNPAELSAIAEQLAVNGRIVIRGRKAIATALGIGESTLDGLLRASKRLRKIVHVDEAGKLVADCIEIRDYIRSLPTFTGKAS